MTPSLPPSTLEHADLPLPRLGSRALFPELSFDSFLAHAAISPTSLITQRAVDTYLSDVAKHGAGSFIRWMGQRERLRSSLARLMGTAETNVGLSPGCTRGITDIALALPWLPGQRLLTFAGEFPANVIPWQQAARLREGSVDLLALPEPESESPGTKILESVEAAIISAGPSARPIKFLAISAVQFQTGLRLPIPELAKLCRAHDVFLLVDGIQACGVLPIEVDNWGVDAFFSGAHKWLLGLEGAGFLALSPQLAGQLQPLTAGWLSQVEGANFLFQGSGHLDYERPLLPSPLAFEGSTLNAAGFAGLEAGVDTCLSLGPQAIFDHVQQLHDGLEPIFCERGFQSLRAKKISERSCILSFEPPAGVRVSELAAALRERGVMISIPDGKVRLSPHFANSLAELDLVQDALSQVVV